MSGTNLPFARMAREPLTSDEANTLRLVATGMRGAPQGWGWDLIIAKLRFVSDKDRS